MRRRAELASSTLARRLGRTSVGKNLIHASVLRRSGHHAVPNVEAWPAHVRGFEDLAFLFSSNQLNHGVASLQIDEAALLYRLAPRRATPGRSWRSGASRAAVHLCLRRLRRQRRRDLVVRPARRAPRRHAGRAARLGAARRARPATASARTCTWSSPTPARSSRRPPRSRCCSSTETIRTRAHGPTSSAGARSSVRAGICSSTTPSIAAATATSIPVSRVPSDEVEHEGGWERQPGAGSIAHFVRA